MQVCSDSYEPKRTTTPVMPNGPTFTVGSLAVDGEKFGEPTTRVDFADAKQSATFAERRISRATSVTEVEKLLVAAIRKLEAALATSSKRNETQSLQARISNVRDAATRRKRDLEAKSAAQMEVLARQKELDLLEEEWNRKVDTLASRREGASSQSELPARSRRQIEDALSRGVVALTGDVPRNIRYAGLAYPLHQAKDGSISRKYPSGVQFSSAGFPDFTPYAIAVAHVDRFRNRPTDFAEADLQAGFRTRRDRPKGYTWHHVEDMRTLLLVPTDLHNEVRHSGGIAAQQNLDSLSSLMLRMMLYSIHRLDHD